MFSVSLTSLLLSSLAAICIYKFLSWCLAFRTWIKKYDNLPGTKSHWLLGNLAENPGIGEGGIAHLYSFVKDFPVLVKYWMSFTDCVVLCHHPDSVRSILKSSAMTAPKPRHTGTIYVLGLEWLGDGLLISNGQKWARNRRLLTPAFHFDVLKPYVRVFNETCDVLLEKLQSFSNEGQEFDMYHHIGLLTLDNMLRCAMSYQTDCQRQGEKNPYVMSVASLSELWANRSISPHLYLDWIYYNFTPSGRKFLRQCKYVHKVSEDIINTRKSQLDTHPMPVSNSGKMSRYRDFLDILLTARDDTGKGLSNLDIRHEVDTFLFEGHDTTKSGVSFTLFSLAQHPNIQDNVRTEVRRVLEGRGTDVFECEDLAKLEYLTLCIKEAMRVYSPVYIIERTVLEDHLINGFTIPKGSTVAVQFYNLHHNPAVWGEDHWDFKPERFLSDNMKDKDPFAFVPFSGGPRNCIGQNFAMNEMKTIIARIINRFSLRLVPGFKLEKEMAVVMRPKSGIKMKVTSVL